MTRQEFDYHCLEYAQVHKELDDIVKSMRDVIKYIFIFLGATYAFLFTQFSIKDTCIPANFRIATFAPTFLVLLSVLGVYFWSRQIRIMRVYLRELETRLAAAELGWEQHLHKQEKPQVVLSWLLWTFLVFGTLWITWAVFPPGCKV